MSEASAMRGEEMAEMARFRREWREGFKQKSIVHLIQEQERFEELIVRYPYHLDEDAKILQEFLDRIETMEDKAIKDVKNDCPIAFFKPSWEQAQLINSWSPDYEPDKAPGGYQSVVDISSVRVGKTCSVVVSTLLWILPNDENWPCFEPYVDHLGRTVQIFRRPQWNHYRKSGRMIYENDEPPQPVCDIWHGCPDESHWKDKLDKEYRKWMPNKWVARKGNDPQWMVADKWFETKWGGRVTGKLYMSDMMAWSGKELFIVNLDEGPPKDKLDEAKFRTEFIQWAFTPREAANTGDRTKVCFDIYQGRECLVGATKFLQSKMVDCPEHIMTRQKREQRVAIGQSMGAAGRVTIEGGFFNSSPTVFSNFNRQRNILPVTGSQIIDAIRGESDPQTVRDYPWIEKFYRANIIRGMDEGLVHPTTCAWMAILKTGEYVMFRELELIAASIAERCEKIIEMSGNERVEFKRHIQQGMTELEMMSMADFEEHAARDEKREQATGEATKRYQERYKLMEIRKTFGDSKLFKRDPNHPTDNWGDNYTRAGLKLERANNAVPQARCDYVNGMLRSDSSRQHLNPRQMTDESPFGAQLYVSIDCVRVVERFENYLWEQIKSGPRVGEFTGQPGKTGDDLLDSVGYACLSRLRWIDMAEIMANRRALAA